MVECFDALIEFASHRKRAIMHIYRSVNREVFERNLMAVTEIFNSTINGGAKQGFETLLSTAEETIGKNGLFTECFSSNKPFFVSLVIS